MRIPAPPPPPRLLRLPDAASYCGVSSRTLLRYADAGIAPAKVTLGPGVSGWLREDLDRWLDSARQVAA